MPGKGLQKVVHSEFYFVVRNKIYDVMAEAFRDFFSAVADSFLQSL